MLPSCFAHPHYTVLEVAEKSGFNSVSTFRRAFVAAHKCSPNEYRAQM